ncbi:uncharacterized protein ACNS7B_012230 isoform 2-T2 [Menidia menidia]|uniref:(Atlantic silverside) hypothetical protein n=1 Tax=Menidia menidia TaxID=238744 RepID=A0A8S4B8L8_9TELE|nr:unnamed protein product [Menidia menidia]
MNFSIVLWIWLLTVCIIWKHCGIQGDTEGATRAQDGNAFFALRSCHQLLRSESGEFFSPDYLCSNPPLWCNWTIQVHPGKRIHLHLEDLTPDETCQFKQDQIHVDEPAGHSGGHKVLQMCWQEAKYTSSSNTLYVVLLIGGWPSPSYRGFYAHYQAFGPPVAYNPLEGFTGRNKGLEPSPGLTEFEDFGPVTNDEQLKTGNSQVIFNYYDQHLDLPAGEPWESETTERITEQQGDSQHNGLKTNTNTSAEQRNASEATAAEVKHRLQSKAKGESTGHGAEQATDEQNRLKVSETSDQPLSSSLSPKLQHNGHYYPRSKKVEQQSDYGGNQTIKNNTRVPHPPGDYLFEVAVEVNFSEDLEESWDSLARLLLLSIKTVITKHMDALHKQVYLSSKRIKRLNAGALYILWLQIGQGSGGVGIQMAVKSAMQGLLNLRATFRNAAIISVSSADVNECGTQLVLCDINADCVNHFGSYSCHCRPGFNDESRFGSGGTICVDAKATECGSGLSTETKGVYVLFFLLSSLILTLMVVAGTLYHRHHRGAFLVRCQSNGSLSPPDANNNNHLHPHDSYSGPIDTDLPPPPPPSRAVREGWAPAKDHCRPVDLPLLRFNSLMPPDGYIDPQDSGKM